jgi:leucyl aminopeptidase
MLRIITSVPAAAPLPALIVPVCEDRPLHPGTALKSLVDEGLAHQEFRGRKGQEIVLYRPQAGRTERAILIGLGKGAALDPEGLRQAVGRGIKRCIKIGVSRAAVAVPDPAACGLPAPALVTALAEAAVLANHLFDRFKQEKETRALARIDLLAPAGVARRVQGLPGRIETVCRAVLTAREWVNLPSNEKPPEAFARMIAAEARRAGLRVQVWREAELRRRKFGALLAVAAGSRNRPALVILEHRPRGARGTIALVGKGVTFDSGGINLKTGPTIAEMKADMAGGAAVAAALAAVARLGLKRHVVGLIPLVENMPSGTATRPGDIVRTYAGRTVEIGNTDAEGRLILADAIAHAIRAFAPEVVIDLATLTGACVVALGEKMAGVFANDLPLQEAIAASGRRTHERCWPMPLPEDYKELLKSDVADLSNVPPSRYGGAIAAALFLAEFAGATRWAHIDIAGPAFNKKEDGYTTPGATGFGVRLLLDWLAGQDDPAGS